jgi:hypothetical protein
MMAAMIADRSACRRFAFASVGAAIFMVIAYLLGFFE